MSTPPSEQLHFAAEWLDINNGDGAEGPSCHAVADFLRELADKQDQRAVIQQVARENGVSVQAVKSAIKAKAKREELKP